MKNTKIHITIGLVGLLIVSIIVGQYFLSDVDVPIVSYEVEDISNLTTEEKVNDFLYLYDVFSTSYPYFGILERQHGVDWLANKESYVDRIKDTEDNLAYYEALSSILGELHQGHTNIIHPRSYDYYQEVYKGKIHRPWEQVLSHENVKNRYQYWKDLLGVKEEKRSVRERAEESRKGNVKFQVLEENKIAYMKVKSLNALYIEEDGKEILEFYGSIKDYPYLIIDIRGNGGGSTNYWIKNIVQPLLKRPLTADTINVFRGSGYLMPFVEARVNSIQTIGALPDKENYPAEVKEMKMFSHFYSSSITISPKNRVGFEGEIYLLVDEGVYSSSEAFAVFVKDTNWAHLVGTRTGGDGVGFDPVLVALPYSGLVVRFPGAMGLVGDGSANEEKKTTPYLLIDPEKEDALGKTLRLINGN